MPLLDVGFRRTRLVEAHIAAGRLVAPFDVVLPADAGFYVVAQTRPPTSQRLRCFGLASWLRDSGHRGTAACAGRVRSVAVCGQNIRCASGRFGSKKGMDRWLGAA